MTPTPEKRKRGRPFGTKLRGRYISLKRAIRASVERRKHDFYEANIDVGSPKGRIRGWIIEAIIQWESEYPELKELRAGDSHLAGFVDEDLRLGRFIDEIAYELGHYEPARRFVERKNKHRLRQYERLRASKSGH